MNNKYTIKTYQLKKELPNEPQAKSLRFVFVSDLHNHEFGPDNLLLLQEIERLNPDAVLVGGDTMVGKADSPMDVALDFITALADRFPVYYANGNHEYRLRIYPEQYKDMYQRFLEVIHREGVHHLVNRSIYTEFRGVPVAIHGFEADRKYYHRFKKADMPVSYLNDIFGRPDPDYYHILLAHNPDYIHTYLKWGADLTLSGHCHGGVMRLGEHYGLISPNMKLFYPYAHGLFYGENNNCMLVSAGLGEHTIPVRLFNPRELVVVSVDFSNKQN